MFCLLYTSDVYKRQDWYFEDYSLGGFDSVGFTSFTVGSGSQMLTTIPTLDWVAKGSGWSFSVKTYGAQCSVDPYNTDAGNGQIAGSTGNCSTSTQPVTTSPATAAYYPLVDTPGDCP